MESKNRRKAELIAHICSLWTLLSSSNFYDIKQKEYLFQPHPAQVISIFRMLGMGYKTGFKTPIINTLSKTFGYDRDTSLRNNLVQIGTGEGKSFILAVNSVVLALIGFDVYCVCNSEYLSDRDFQAFKSLFEILNLTEKKSYGTFHKICENMINANGDVRSTVQKMVLKNQLDYNQTNTKTSACPRVLLIDEVDVFFTKDFYGNSYNPILKLIVQTIIDLIISIWKERNKSLKFIKVKTFDTFKKCVNIFSNWQELIEEGVKDMLLALKTFSNHQYTVKDDKIGYKYHDDINFNTSYGYNTIFAYLLENERGNISNSSLIYN